MGQPRILAFAGSTREASFNKRLVRAAAGFASAAGAAVTAIDLRDFPLPLFDEDIEARDGLPEPGRRLKELFRQNDGLLISTAEYNSSLPAVLKNAIDWLSRPEAGQAPLSCFNGKVAAIMAASPGALGGLRCLYHLRAVLQNINVMVLPEMRAVSSAQNAFDDQGAIRDEGVRTAVERIARQLVDTVRRLAQGARS